jgi:hypothetical protein
MYGALLQCFLIHVKPKGFGSQCVPCGNPEVRVAGKKMKKNPAR